MKKTLFNLAPESCGPDAALFHVLPIPYSGADEICRGMDAAPDAILGASANMERFDVKSRRPLDKFGVYTHDLVPTATNAEQEFAAIEDVARRLDLFRPRRIPIALGGSRAISTPLIRVAAEKYPDLSVLQLSACAALRDSFGADGRLSRACVMARVSEVVRDIVQVGTRSFSQEEYERFPERIDAIVSPEEIEDDFERAVEKILWKTGVDVYLTVDMDVFDPGAVPGVGLPEPGGLTWRQVVALIEAVVAGKNLVAADVVGTKPLGGGNIVSEYAAAKLIGKIIGAVARKRA